MIEAIHRMFEDIQLIKGLVRDRTLPGHLPYQLEHIRDAVISVTDLDRILAYEVPLERANHFQGRYMRFEWRNAVYGEPEAVAAIEYSSRLNSCGSRFVICKEMCQALLRDPAVRADTEGKLAQLCEELRLPPAQQDALTFSERVASEKAAQFAASEILCPLEDRKEISERRSQGQEIDDLTIAQAFRVPQWLVEAIFEPTYIAKSSELFDASAAATAAAAAAR